MVLNYKIGTWRQSGRHLVDFVGTSATRIMVNRHDCFKHTKVWMYDFCCLVKWEILKNNWIFVLICKLRTVRYWNSPGRNDFKFDAVLPDGTYRKSWESQNCHSWKSWGFFFDNISIVLQGKTKQVRWCSLCHQ